MEEKTKEKWPMAWMIPINVTTPHQELKDFICASSLDTYHSIILYLLNNRLTNLAVPRSLGLSISFSKETPGEEGVDWTCLSFNVMSCNHRNRSLAHVIDNIMYQKACKKFKRASQKVGFWQEIAIDPKRNRLMNSELFKHLLFDVQLYFFP